MTKVVINAGYGGFGLSDTAHALYCAYASKDPDKYSNYDVARDDPILLQVIAQLGIDECSGRYADLKVVEIPDGVEWTIEENDGKEWVAEAHRIWR